MLEQRYGMEKFTITPRKIYMDKIFQLLDNKNILIVSGVRRTGKTCIAEHLEKELNRLFPVNAQIIRINFETIEQVRVTADELLDRLNGQLMADRMNYILLDEIIHIMDWEMAINALFHMDNCKLILFSSNRRVYSEKLSAYREGKCDTIHALPLSLQEFVVFQRFEETTKPSIPLCEKKYHRFSGESYKIDEIYKFYITYGGLPILRPEYMDRERAWVVTDGSYGAIVTRDIMEMGSGEGNSAVTDTPLLRAIITIMAKSLGNNISATWISKQTTEYLGRSSSTKTIESYIRALLNAHLFYIAERYDIKKGRVLKTLAKYYIVDACFHNYVADIHVDDEKSLLENKVYFELLRRGYTVYNGKIGKEEIAFVADKGGEKIYIQITDKTSEKEIKRLCSPLRKVPEHATKMLIIPGCKSDITYEGFVLMNAYEFLMGAEMNW